MASSFGSLLFLHLPQIIKLNLERFQLSDDLVLAMKVQHSIAGYFSSVIETTCSILISLSASLNLIGWGVPILKSQNPQKYWIFPFSGGLKRRHIASYLQVPLTLSPQGFEVFLMPKDCRTRVLWLVVIEGLNVVFVFLCGRDSGIYYLHKNRR